MLRIKTVISNGIACGKCVRIRNSSKKYDTYSSNSDLEISLFVDAINNSLKELDDMENNLSGDSLNTLYLVYAVAGIFVFSMIYKRLFGESIKVSLKGISSHPGSFREGICLPPLRLLRL